MLAALAMLGLLCLGQAASVHADEGPAHFVQHLGRKAIDMLSDDTQNGMDRERTFRSLLIEHFDVKKMGRLVMGRHWRMVSDLQKAEFFRLFEDFIVATYASRLSEYSDQEFTVGATRQNSKRITAVSSQITSTDGTSIDVDWMLQPKADRWYVVDIVIEGISMIITQRAEFGTVINQRGGIDGLLQSLNSKIAEAVSGQT